MAKNELDQLKVTWAWKDTNLRLAGIGTPKIIVKNILETGRYVPYVPSGSIRKNKNKIKDFDELLAEANIDESALFDEDSQQVLKLAGDLPVVFENEKDQVLERVEKKTC